MAGSPDTNSLWLGDRAVLDASGVASTSRDARGLTQGRVLDGGGMAVWQAIGAFQLFTGRQPDTARMERHFRSMITAQA